MGRTARNGFLTSQKGTPSPVNELYAAFAEVAYPGWVRMFMQV